jgi:hypothetical protein
MAEIGISEAEIVALFLASLFYGIFLISAGFGVRYLLYETSSRPSQALKRRTIPWKLIVPEVILLIITSTHISLSVTNCIRIFVKQPGSPDAYDPTIWINKTKVCVCVSLPFFDS